MIILPTDKASNRYYNYLDLLYSKIKIFKFIGKIKSGKAVIINKNVEIKITDNGKLFMGDLQFEQNASIILTKPDPFIKLKQMF